MKTGFRNRAARSNRLPVGAGVVLLLLLQLFSCTREVPVPAPRSQSFTASFGQNKTVLQEDGTSIFWGIGERIAVRCAESGVYAPFVSRNTEPAAEVTFEGSLAEILDDDGNLVVPSGYWAVYPFDAAVPDAGDGDGDALLPFVLDSVTVSLPLEQAARADSVAHLPAVAFTPASNFLFRQVCGGFVFTVSQEHIRKISFRALGKEALSGLARVGLDDEGYPHIGRILEPVDSVVFTKPDETDFIPGERYFVALPPCTLSKGFALTFYKPFAAATYTCGKGNIVVSRGRFGELKDLDAGLTFGIPVSEIRVAPSQGISLNVGDAPLRLTVQVLPVDASGPALCWESSDEKVATVDENGLVTAVGKGDCIVTARAMYYPDVAAQCPVHVTAYTDLSKDGSANCYIVPAAGDYRFRADRRGKSNEAVGKAASARVLWETYGNTTTPKVGAIIPAASVSLADGFVYFSTPTSLKNGNAVIAVQDAAGKILWSWHIWMCKGFDPEAGAQTYCNKDGETYVMMDRNLGAISATPGEVGCLGLLYQWGRKDPFVSSSYYDRNYEAKTTATWPEPVTVSSSTGTISYTIANPMRFICASGSQTDWLYTVSGPKDASRWREKEDLYGPCPRGWHLPEGGSTGIWSRMFGVTAMFKDAATWQGTVKGMDLQAWFNTESTCWYPAAGHRLATSGKLLQAASVGYYWSRTSASSALYCFVFTYQGNISPTMADNPADAMSVRCEKE